MGSTATGSAASWLRSSSYIPGTDLSLLARSRPGDERRASLTSPPPWVLANVRYRAPDIEEDSLTLLKYKQYFTERPLCRCLDAQLPPPEHAESISSDATEGGASNPASELRSSLLDSSAGKSAPVHRERREVENFWRDVRQFLWISDEELDEYRTCSDHAPSESYPASSNAQSDGTPWTESSISESSYSLSDRSAASNGVYQSSGSPNLQRVLSMEETMSEIDSFLSEDESGPSPEDDGYTMTSLSSMSTAETQHHIEEGVGPDSPTPYYGAERHKSGALSRRSPRRVQPDAYLKIQAWWARAARPRFMGRGAQIP